MLAGRVELLVDQFDEVEAGTPLYRIDSPHWREIQQSIASADAKLRNPRRPSSGASSRSGRHAIAGQPRPEHRIGPIGAKKLQLLQEAGGGQLTELIAAQASLADARAALSEVHEEEAKLRADRIQTENKVDSAQSQFTLAIDNAASLLEMEPKQLLETSP